MLAKLTGSEKQINWAESIRHSALITLIHCLNPMVKHIMKEFESIEPAEWWIENREWFKMENVILPFGLVYLAQMGEASACDEILRIQYDSEYRETFIALRITQE